MTTVRNIALFVIGVGCVVVVLSPVHRRSLARKLADARRIVSRRVVDEDARTSSRAVEAWEDEGGAVMSQPANQGRSLP